MAGGRFSLVRRIGQRAHRATGTERRAPWRRRARAASTWGNGVKTARQPGRRTPCRGGPPPGTPRRVRPATGPGRVSDPEPGFRGGSGESRLRRSRHDLLSSAGCSTPYCRWAAIMAAGRLPPVSGSSPRSDSTAMRRFYTGSAGLDRGKLPAGGDVPGVPGASAVVPDAAVAGPCVSTTPTGPGAGPSPPGSASPTVGPDVPGSAASSTGTAAGLMAAALLAVMPYHVRREQAGPAGRG